MKMYYCCIEDIFEGIFDSREKCIEAIKERFNAIDWMGEKPIIERIKENAIKENAFECDGIEAPIIDLVFVKWENVDELASYEIIGCNVNKTYSC